MSAIPFPWKGSRSVRNRHNLRFEVLAEPLHTMFAAKAGFLVAAERHVRSTAGHGIHGQHTGPQASRDFDASCVVARVHDTSDLMARAQPWPAWEQLIMPMLPIAAARSASSRMMLADLPLSSRSNFFTVCFAVPTRTCRSFRCPWRGHRSVGRGAGHESGSPVRRLRQR